MMSKVLNKPNFLMAGVAASCFMFAPAVAQETTAPETEDATEVLETPGEEEEMRQEKIVVTGSLLRKDEFSSAAPIQVITSEMSTLEGLVDTGEILQGSSIAAGSVQFNNKFGTFIIEGGTGINSISLRGLGAQRSLVLLNSRRPGPAGTGGSVGPFDLNVIPASAINRVEILKDGASSIYGSDAVAGVANVITRTSIEEPELTVQYNQPADGGGESFQINGGFGLNFDLGNIMVTGSYTKREPLKFKDRNYLSCSEHLVTDASSGRPLIQEDRSILGGSSLAGCDNTFTGLIRDFFFYGTDFVPSATGATEGPLEGFEEFAYNGEYTNYILNSEQFLNTDVFNAQELMSVYATSSFDLPANITWDTEWLYTKRETRYEYGRQFAPLIGSATTQSIWGIYGYANDPTYDNPFTGINLPITELPLFSEANVDYFYVATGLDGDFSFMPIDYFKDWAWSVDVLHSKSDGDYGGLQVIASRSGDVRFDANSPTYNPYTLDWLLGNDQTWWDDVTDTHYGNTEYEQSSITAVVTGDLFSLPAGDVGIALGTEMREFSIDDQPSDYAVAGDLFNVSSGLPTVGDDDVVEFFAEVEVPILKGIPGFEALTLSGSARTFNYASYGVDDVWKAGVDWQIVPTLRIRGTKGTSYRAPALYELFLGETSGFQNGSIDPCIRWEDSTNENLRTNCAAEGIPEGYTGGASSILVLSSGGVDNGLQAETSEAETLGLVFTPTFIDLSIAIDYFNIEIFDQVTSLGGSSILSNCYFADNFPNEFCTLFSRNAADDPQAPYAIQQINSGYVNVNRQSTRGIDYTVRYEHDFDFGDLSIDLSATQTLEEELSIFNPALENGFDTEDYNGTIGDPEWAGNGTVMFERGDLTYTWSMDYLGPTSNSLYTDARSTYFGADAIYVVDTPSYWTHDFSVRYRRDTWTLLGGVANLFDEQPPTVSTGVTSRYGNTPAFAGYDLYGRTFFARVTKTF